MAEFCLECFNEHVLPDGYPKRRAEDVTLSVRPEFCEGCCQIKRVVVLDRPTLWRRILRNFRKK